MTTIRISAEKSVHTRPITPWGLATAAEAEASVDYLAGHEAEALRAIEEALADIRRQIPTPTTKED